MNIEALWQIAGQSGTEEFTGTSSTMLLPANKRKVCDPKNQYFFGQITNLSNVDVRITVALHNVSTGIHTHDLRAKETLNIRGLPVDYIGVILNGSVLVHGMGVIVVLSQAEMLSMIGQIGLYETLNDYRNYRFNLNTHTDITTATTTTVLDPAAGKTSRIYKISIAADGACLLTIRRTDSAGAGAVTIATVRFGGAGTWTYDFGDNGWENPSGEDALVRIVSNNTADVDVDITSEDVDLQ